MTQRELNKALASVRFVFVWAPITHVDGAYIEVSKAALRRALKQLKGSRFQAEIRPDQPDALYLG